MTQWQECFKNIGWFLSYVQSKDVFKGDHRTQRTPGNQRHKIRVRVRDLKRII